MFYHYMDEDILVVTVDVDDLTMTGNSWHVMAKFKRELSSQFKLKDLGDLKWLLGIEVERDHHSHSITYSQRAYINRILSCFNFLDVKPLSMPLDPQHKLDLLQCPTTPQALDNMCAIPYWEAIGSLMYAALGTHLDIAFAVSYLSQFIQNPRRLHWEAIKRVFCYLKGARNYILKIGGNGQHGLQGYCDADWALQQHHNSTSGYIFVVNGGAVSWSSKKWHCQPLKPNT